MKKRFSTVLLVAFLAAAIGLPAEPAQGGTIETVPYDHSCFGYAGSVGPGTSGDAPIPGLRIMAYNIAHGEPFEHLVAAAETINDLQPDVLVLNEVLCRWGSADQDRQARWLAQATGLPHFAYESATPLGFAGTIGVAVLSRFPISQVQMHKVVYNGWETKFGTMRSVIRIGGRSHTVFSTRLAPMHPYGHPEYRPEAEPENRAGHIQGLDLVRLLTSTNPIIFAGDLNANWSRLWSTQFRDQSGLIDAYLSKFDGAVPLDNRVDYIYERGYDVVSARMALGREGASDHAFVFTELVVSPPPPGSVVVPNVVGLTASEGAAILNSAGFAVNRSTANDCESPSGIVISQSPIGGWTALGGATVTTVVSTFNARICSKIFVGP